MSLHPDIRGIFFDLDGTLYESPRFAATIQEAAADYIAELRQLEAADARRLIAETRSRLIEERDEIPTLSAVCSELGGNINGMHAFFESHIQPEVYLAHDPRVVAMMTRLRAQFPLYLYTNNNRVLTNRILNQLALNGIFRHIYAIDDTWTAKPDAGMLEMILAESGLRPAQALFVGDRYDVDLRLPEQMGCPVYLSQTIDQLLRLEELLNI